MQGFIFLFFAITEVVIGVLQCASVLNNVIQTHDVTLEKIILLIAGFLSFFLGLGLALKKSLAVKTLIFFASGVAFSKFLIMAGVFTLPDISKVLFDKSIENTVSFFYHATLAMFLLRGVQSRH